MKGKFRTILSAVIIAITAAQMINYFAQTQDGNKVSPEIALAFMKWTSIQNKIYVTPEEFIHRINIFAQNYNLVKKWRLNYTRSYELELNKFADLSDEEFGAKFGLKNADRRIEAKWENDGTFGGPNRNN